MANAPETASNPEAERDLQFTQSLRKRLIKELVKKKQGEGEAPIPADQLDPDAVEIPGENSDKTLLIQLLDGTDRQALGRMRIEVDKNANAGAAAANTALIAELIKGSHLKDHGIVEGAGTIPKLPADTPRPTLVPGQLDHTGSGVNWREFENQQQQLQNGGAPPAP